MFSSGNRPAALEAAIKAAELYLRARNQVPSPQEKQRLEKKCNQLLLKAERWKKAAASAAAGPVLSPAPPPSSPRAGPKAARQLSIREKTLLLKSSKIKGNKFPPWTAPPALEEFAGDHTYL